MNAGSAKRVSARAIHRTPVGTTPMASPDIDVMACPATMNTKAMARSASTSGSHPAAAVWAPVWTRACDTAALAAVSGAASSIIAAAR